jgi:hypothetical protein
MKFHHNRNEITYQIMLCFNFTIECLKYQSDVCQYLSFHLYLRIKLPQLISSYWLYQVWNYLVQNVCLWHYLTGFTFWLFIFGCVYVFGYIFGYVHGYLSAPQLIQIDAFIPSLKYIEVRSVYFRHAKYVTIYVLTVLIIN